MQNRLNEIHKEYSLLCANAGEIVLRIEALDYQLDKIKAAFLVLDEEAKTLKDKIMCREKSTPSDTQ